MKPRVLITALGTVTASSIAIELKKENNFYLIGADINKSYEIATSIDVDEFYTFPLATESFYLEYVIEFCRKHDISYYYAVIDKEVVNITRNRDKFRDIGVKLCVVNSSFAEKCHYKNKFADWISDNYSQISIKTYNNYGDITESVFPLFIKPIEGVASDGCRKIDCFEDFDKEVNLGHINSAYLVQEYVEGRVITVDLVRNRLTGEMAQIQRVELLRNGNGCGIAVEIVNNRKLEEICIELMKKLDLNGVCNAEFFDCGNDVFKIIEINPRFSAGTRYSCMAGINTVKNAMLIADEKPCEFGTPAYGKHYAERYEAYEMD